MQDINSLYCKAVNILLRIKYPKKFIEFKITCYLPYIIEITNIINLGNNVWHNWLFLKK